MQISKKIHDGIYDPISIVKLAEVSVQEPLYNSFGHTFD